MSKSNAERQKQFHQKMLTQGNARVVVYAPSERAQEIRTIASSMRERASNPDVLRDVQIALIEAKGALSASVDGNTRNSALEAVKGSLVLLQDYAEPI